MLAIGHNHVALGVGDVRRSRDFDDPDGITLQVSARNSRP